MKVFHEHPLWSKVLFIANTLKKHGHQAWLAGGCVRDALIGVPPKDFDIATDATPEKLKILFPEALDVGRAFGVMIVPVKMVGKEGEEYHNMEIATFRRDGAYQDGRHPVAVAFSTPEEDAKRRDFTINALFYDLENDQIVDFVNGRKDLDEQLIRAVGEPKKRFEEDQLRLLRGMRLAAQLDFKIEPETWAAIQECHSKIVNVSKERIRDEFLKTLRSPRSDLGFGLMEQSGILKIVLPEILQGDWATSMDLLKNKKASLSETTLWCLLFYEYSKTASTQDVKLVMKRLKNPGEVVHFTADILAASHRLAKPDMRLAHKMRTKVWLGSSFMEFVEELSRKTKNPSILLEYQKLPDALPAPILTGQDLLDLGVSQGPAFAPLLDECYCLQLEGKILDKKEALEWAKKEI